MKISWLRSGITMVGSLEVSFASIATIGMQMHDSTQKGYSVLNLLFSSFLVRSPATCFTCFILGLPMCFSDGVYLFTLLDWNTAFWAILLIGILECTAVSWSYGINRAMRDLASMNMKLNPVLRFYWKAVWTFIVPIGSLVILVFVFIEWTPPSYGDYKFPLFADLLGWAVGLSTLILFPVGVCWILWKGHRGKDLYHPKKNWKPAVRIEDISGSKDRVPNMTILDLFFLEDI